MAQSYATMLCPELRSMPMPKEIGLATRVSLLEARFSLMNEMDHRAKSKASPGAGSAASSPGSTSQSFRYSSKYSQLPPEPVLRSLLDTFFRSCQNQPYVYFRQAVFYRRLEDKEYPDYLLLAMIALSARFSDEPFFESQQLAAVDFYGRTAWSEIFDQAFADDTQLLDIHMVQATNLLAVVDFTAGRHRLGWVKIGLAVRFAQSLQLNTEPRSDLPFEEQDERRLTFWSVYLLDRLASCGAYRPSTIADSDCSTLLPSDCPDAHQTMPGLRLLEEMHTIHETRHMDPFTYTILMASALGRVERQALQQQGSTDRYPPWDSRSDFAAIYSLLLSFEGYSRVTDASVSDAVRTHYLDLEGSID
ncbi:hypothetical protein PV08_06570 [Exophiala spinifera]|uniref:Xylanolytic transcriptional activator regulatory domain-containing protein n=1 Tax=Exophiala spinifera TaxID=91928 RepID=A0A0D2BD57_9EURO|nr:uncharacterized protein PV08_06570 [Exophiala spinifera]KIW16515.1 hypothetical protein PV08_06570 [Exophiala spinifera]